MLKEKHVPYTFISVNKMNWIESLTSSYIPPFFKKNIAVVVLHTSIHMLTKQAFITPDFKKQQNRNKTELMNGTKFTKIFGDNIINIC